MLSFKVALIAKGKMEENIAPQEHPYDLHEEHSSNVSLDTGIKHIGTGEVEGGGTTASVAGTGELDVGDGLLLDASDELDLGGIEGGHLVRADHRAVGGSEGGREGGNGGKNGSGLHFNGKFVGNRVWLY